MLSLIIYIEGVSFDAFLLESESSAFGRLVNFFKSWIEFLNIENIIHMYYNFINIVQIVVIHYSIPNSGGCF